MISDFGLGIQSLIVNENLVIIKKLLQEQMVTENYIVDIINKIDVNSSSDEFVWEIIDIVEYHPNFNGSNLLLCLLNWDNCTSELSKKCFFRLIDCGTKINDKTYIFSLSSDMFFYYIDKYDLTVTSEDIISYFKIYTEIEEEIVFWIHDKLSHSSTDIVEDCIQIIYHCVQLNCDWAIVEKFLTHVIDSSDYPCLIFNCAIYEYSNLKKYFINQEFSLEILFASFVVNLDFHGADSDSDSDIYKMCNYICENNEINDIYHEIIDHFNDTYIRGNNYDKIINNCKKLINILTYNNIMPSIESMEKIRIGL